MILLVDVGNSNIVFAFTKDGEVYKTYRFKSLSDKTSDDYYILLRDMLEYYKFNDVLISSVVPIITSALRKLFLKYFNIEAKILGPGIKTGIQLKVDDPKTVGADMISDVAGAMIYSKEAIIIDLGTATKYIYCKDNTFLGCSIAPGIAISMKALVNNAALLPNVEMVAPKNVISTNTISCIQSGVIFGAASQVDGMVNRIKRELNCPNALVIATGGLSEVIIPFCENKIILDKNLTLLGLLEIYKKNK